MLKGKEVKISAERYFELLKSENKLNGLECAGVDNWSNFGSHLEYMEDNDYLLDEVKTKITL